MLSVPVIVDLSYSLTHFSLFFAYLHHSLFIFHLVVEFMYHSLGCGTAKNKEAAKADMMQRVDANGDGKLDASEFIALFEQVYIESNKPLEAIAVIE